MNHPRQEDFSERSLTFNELRQNTFNLLLICIGGGTAILLWLSNIRVRTSSADQVVLWLVFEAICVLSYVLSRKHFSLAVLFLLAGLWLCNAFAAWHFSLPLFLNL